MDWLKAVSQLVAKEGQPMSWITPLGLPVLQPYRRTDQFQVKHMCMKVGNAPCMYSSVKRDWHFAGSVTMLDT